ncbi:unnamed protein product [Anisakis simplex]|uniref:phosphoenolpyruvate carboxykinase (GTP) n=1 Tax=Anisakis simplex TaxID=6269 RepID=A0A0M3J949_ANISI|nr:unnamed protein product [Anisakis simplex]
MAMDVEKREIWSVGCGCEDAILCKTEAALRMASLVGKRERWLAERMTIIAITAPDKSEHFIGLAGPDGSGKTTLAFMQPTLPGWQGNLEVSRNNGEEREISTTLHFPIF